MNLPRPFSQPLVLLGAGGHAKVLLSLVRAAGYAVIGVCDPALAHAGMPHWRGLPVMGDDSALDRLAPTEVDLANGLGQLIGGTARERLFTELSARGFKFPTLIHPTAWVDPTARIGIGAQLMAGVIVQADAEIGDNSILNTGARIDHDCVVGNHVHLAPGATLCGAVQVGARAFVGAGATVIQGLRLGDAAVVAAGAIVSRDLGSRQHWLGTRPRPSL